MVARFFFHASFYICEISLWILWFSIIKKNFFVLKRACELAFWTNYYLKRKIPLKSQATEETWLHAACIEQEDNIQCALTPNKKINLMVAIRKLFILYYLYNVICRFLGFFVHWIFSGFKGFHSDEGGQMPLKI